jgi:hypothetical protein
VSVPLVGENGDRVGALLVTNGGHPLESIPQGLKPFWCDEREAKAKALAYLEAGQRPVGGAANKRDGGEGLGCGGWERNCRSLRCGAARLRSR